MTVERGVRLMARCDCVVVGGAGALLLTLLAVADGICRTQSPAISFYQLVPCHEHSARDGVEGRKLQSNEDEGMMHERRFPASQAQRLESPERLVWLPPAKVVEALAVQPGETVADVGAGTGYFSLPLASAVGDEGRLYAVDAQAEMLEWLREKLDKSRLSNIDLILAEADRTGLSASSCDLFFLANLWHEIEDRVAVSIRKPGEFSRRAAELQSSTGAPMSSPSRGRPWRIESRPLMLFERCGRRIRADGFS